MADAPTLINLFEVPGPEQDDAFLEGWERPGEFINQRVSEIETALHRSLERAPPAIPRTPGRLSREAPAPEPRPHRLPLREHRLVGERGRLSRDHRAAGVQLTGEH